MKTSTSKLERFVLHQLRALPVADSGRNQMGVLWFKWISPCPEIEALWLSVTQHEVVLSCKVAHYHFSRCAYQREKLTNLWLKRRIARDSVMEAARFLLSEIAVATEITDDDSLGSSMWCQANQLPAALEYSRQILGPSKHRAWVWSGEIKC